MTIEARRVGAATLGLAEGPGEPVWYDISLEHNGSSVISFAGSVKSVSGKGFEHLYRQPTFLRIDEGPTIEVTVTELDGEFAILKLTHPEAVA